MLLFVIPSSDLGGTTGFEFYSQHERGRDSQHGAEHRVSR